MNPGHWRQPKIIRLLAAAGLVAVGLGPQRAEAPRAPCVPCLVIGIDGSDLATTGELAPGSLAGLQVLVTADPDNPITRQALQRLSAAGAIPGVAIESDAIVNGDWLSDARFVVVRLPPSLVPSAGEPRKPDTTGDVEQRTFEARTTITALHAARPDLAIVVDGDSLVAAGLALHSIAPYVDAVVGAGGTWLRVPAQANPTVDDLVAASLTPGAERVLVPAEQI